MLWQGNGKFDLLTLTNSGLNFVSDSDRKLDEFVLTSPNFGDIYALKLQGWLQSARFLDAPNFN